MPVPKFVCEVACASGFASSTGDCLLEIREASFRKSDPKTHVPNYSSGCGFTHILLRVGGCL